MLKQVSKTVGRKRLLKLATMLEEDAENKKGIKFDLAVVGRNRLPSSGLKKFELNCNTTACAVGLAAISGRFKRAGLSYQVVGSEIVTVMFGHSLPFHDAACCLFNITLDEVRYLFVPAAYPYNKRTGAAGERLVAKRIRDFVVNGPPSIVYI